MYLIYHSGAILWQISCNHPSLAFQITVQSRRDAEPWYFSSMLQLRLALATGGGSR